jgi:hypothetical protein
MSGDRHNVTSHSVIEHRKYRGPVSVTIYSYWYHLTFSRVPFTGANQCHYVMQFTPARAAFLLSRGCFSLDFFPHFYRIYRYFPYPHLPPSEKHLMPSPTGMQIYDTQGHRLYLTGSERAAFRQAAEAAPREVRTYCWTLGFFAHPPSCGARHET